MTKEPRNGKIYMVQVPDEGPVVKRVYPVGHFLNLVSDNLTEYPDPITLDLTQNGENPIVGRVVWAWVEFE